MNRDDQDLKKSQQSSTGLQSTHEWSDQSFPLIWTTSNMNRKTEPQPCWVHQKINQEPCALIEGGFSRAAGMNPRHRWYTLSDWLPYPGEQSDRVRVIIKVNGSKQRRSITAPLSIKQSPCSAAWRLWCGTIGYGSGCGLIRRSLRRAFIYMTLIITKL